MNISELIEELQNIKNEYGDIEVYVKDSFTCNDNEIMDVYREEDGRVCIFTD